jgi:hypothetical protein
MHWFAAVVSSFLPNARLGRGVILFSFREAGYTGVGRCLNPGDYPRPICPGLSSKHLSNQLERIQHMDKQSAVRK